MWSESLWTKTLVSVILGFFCSVSLCINIGFTVPIPRDVFLFFSVVAGFIGWAAIISWFFCVQSIKKPAIICLIIFSLSAVINAWFYIGNNS